MGCLLPLVGTLLLMYVPVSVGECGGTLTDLQGVITSPNYPDNYNTDDKCKWTVTVQDRKRVRLTFNDFKLQPRDRDGTCSDYLEVFDGIGSLGKFCGNGVNRVIKSRHSFARIVFVSDAMFTYRGFNISYGFVDYGSSSSDCGGILTAPGGVITSPNYPDNYYNFQKCLWEIEAPSGKRIRLTFNDFKLQPRNEDCSCDDYLEVSDGNTTLGKFCGEDVRHTIKSRNKFVRIVFASDARDTYKGFDISYEHVDENSTECDVTLTDRQGVITSPNYPDKYNNMEYCSWKVKAPEGSRIRLTFNDFKLQPAEGNGYCNDFLELSDGFGRWGTFCGEVPKHTFMSRENFVQFKFVSDGRATSTGFNISYDFVDENSTECGGLLTDPQGVITSPNYPKNYRTQENCQWMIVSVREQRIKLTFNDFRLQKSEECRHSSLQLFDGNRLWRNLCGKGRRDTIVSKNSFVRIVFLSASSKTFQGFNISYGDFDPAEDNYPEDS